MPLDKKNANINAFLTLLRAGLWENKSVHDLPFSVDWAEVYRLAEEQSVVGLVAAGLENAEGLKRDKGAVLPFLSQVIVLEQRNAAMNQFIAKVDKLLKLKDVQAVLVKGQGVAQCYERPLWRAAGDVDLLLDAENYEKAKAILLPLASNYEKEIVEIKHQEMNLNGFELELHGSFNTKVLSRADKVIEKIQKQVTGFGEVRVWRNGDADVFLPSVNKDTILVFAHILQHFYKGGIGLRQVCDWSRLLWTYRDSIDRGLLLKYLVQMDIVPEWKGFAALAVDTLGMPSEAMPLYDANTRWSSKGRRILALILDKGNFGHNEDNSYYREHSFLVVKVISFWRRINDFCRHFMIFPKNSLRAFRKILAEGFTEAAKGA